MIEKWCASKHRSFSPQWFERLQQLLTPSRNQIMIRPRQINKFSKFSIGGTEGKNQKNKICFKFARFEKKNWNFDFGGKKSKFFKKSLKFPLLPRTTLPKVFRFLKTKTNSRKKNGEHLLSRSNYDSKVSLQAVPKMEFIWLKPSQTVG